MQTIEKIVVGVEMPDSRPWNVESISAPSRIAVRQAFEVAEAFNSALQLVCVLSPVSAGLFGDEQAARAAAEQEKTEAMAVLADLEMQHMNQAGRAVDVSSLVTFGRPWLEILKAAGPSHRNLIMCGTRDHGAVSRLLFGTTGLKLLRNAPCAVWLVKPRIDDDADLDVLAATDLSEVGKAVLDAGVMLGQTLPVKLSVLHAVDDDLDRHMARSGVSGEQIAMYREKEKREAEQKLHDQLAAADYRTVQKGVQVHVAEGRPDAAILSAIENLDIDLLIMATAGRGGIPGMLFGNTAERLLPELPCSLLALKPDDFVCPVSLETDSSA
ncbi:MAG: universal stress protein [Fuerstiella sp.]